MLIDSHKWTGKDIAWAYANRCAALAALKQNDKALADCSEAIAQDGDLAIAHEVRGQLYSKHGDYAQALADFDKAIALGASNAGVFSRGGVCGCSRATRAARWRISTGRSKSPAATPNSWLDRGSAQLGVGDDARAEQDFAKATELNPKDPQAWLSRGVAALSAGDKAKAAEYFDEALKRDPNMSYAALWRFLARDGSAQASAELQAFPPRRRKPGPSRSRSFTLATPATRKPWPRPAAATSNARRNSMSRAIRS